MWTGISSMLVNQFILGMYKIPAGLHYRQARL